MKIIWIILASFLVLSVTQMVYAADPNNLKTKITSGISSIRGAGAKAGAWIGNTLRGDRSVKVLTYKAPPARTLTPAKRYLPPTKERVIGPFILIKRETITTNTTKYIPETNKYVSDRVTPKLKEIVTTRK